MLFQLLIEVMFIWNSNLEKTRSDIKEISKTYAFLELNNVKYKKLLTFFTIL